MDISIVATLLFTGSYFILKGENLYVHNPKRSDLPPRPTRSHGCGMKRKKRKNKTVYIPKQENGDIKCGSYHQCCYYFYYS